MKIVCDTEDNKTFEVYVTTGNYYHKETDWTGTLEQVVSRRWDVKVPPESGAMDLDGFGSKTAALNYLLKIRGLPQLKYRKGKR